MRTKKSIGINFDWLICALCSPIFGVGLIAGIIKNEYSYVNNAQLFILISFLTLAFTVLSIVKSLNLLIVNSAGIELKYLLFPIKKTRKKWREIKCYAIVFEKKKGNSRPISYSRSKIWFINHNDLVIFTTNKKRRLNLNPVIKTINRHINEVHIDVEKTDIYASSKGKRKVVYTNPSSTAKQST